MRKFQQKIYIKFYFKQSKQIKTLPATCYLLAKADHSISYTSSPHAFLELFFSNFYYFSCKASLDGREFEKLNQNGFGGFKKKRNFKI